MRNLFILAVLLLFATSCKYLTPNIMLQTKKDFKYTDLKDTSAQGKEYKLSPNDIIEFRLYSNDGFKLVDLTTVTGNANSNVNFREDRKYIIEYDGFVKLPVIGRTELRGLTVRQAELMLEEKYSQYYVKPFILLEVVNKRIIIFPGNAGTAKVLTLSNANTSLIEALAMSGGITEDGKAWKIKVIRNYSSPTPQVYLIDLSTIDGIQKGGMILQANDIVYVEPRKRLAREALKEMAPVLSIITSLLVTYALITRTAN